MRAARFVATLGAFACAAAFAALSAVRVAAQPASVSPGPCASVDYAGTFALADDGTLYVMKQFNAGPILRFAPGAHGNVAPSSQLCGPQTTIDRPYAIGTARGELYVAGRSSIAIFARDASGDAAPARRIGGTGAQNHTRLASAVGGPIGIDVGADGSIYVLDDQSVGTQATGTDDTVLYQFAPGSAGDVAPLRTVQPRGAGIGVIRAAIIDARARLYFSDSLGGVYVSGPALAPPYVRVARLDPQRSHPLALDGRGRLYVGDGARLHVFAGITAGRPTDAELAGPGTGLVEVDGVQTDAAGRIYVQNCTRHHAEIDVFAPNAHGDTVPLSTLQGDKTHIGCP